MVAPDGDPDAVDVLGADTRRSRYAAEPGATDHRSTATATPPPEAGAAPPRPALDGVADGDRPSLATPAVVLLAIVTWLAAWRRDATLPAVAAAACVAVAELRRRAHGRRAELAVVDGARRRTAPSAGAATWPGERRRGGGGPVALVAAAIVLAVVAAARADAGVASLEPDELGPWAGWARVVDDPQPAAGSTRVIVEVAGERFEIWARGRSAQRRARTWRAGQLVALSGERERLDERRARRVAWQHVVGELTIDWTGDVAPGGPVARASNRVRAAIERAGEHLPSPDGALFRGLVVGDDRDQPREVIERFRASGLSHLTAVSGQNVSFLLAAAGPVLTRLRPWWRWAATIGLIAWFTALTRAEPSILRAGVMAALAATAFTLGRERSPIRILALAVVALVLVDPLLVGSVGFSLSVGATAGVSGPGPWLAARLARVPGLRRVALALGVTLGAQLGVAVPSVVVFGRLPLVSVPANLLAVPVAGAVMLYGLPAGLVAGHVPALAGPLLAPVAVGVRWVDAVAVLGARLEPGPTGQAVGWALLAAGVGGALAFSRHTRDRDGDPPHHR